MKYAVVIAVALVLSVSGAIGLVRTPDPGPSPSSSPARAEPASVTSSSGDLDAVTASLQQRLQQVPEDDRSWATLALAYVEQARTTGDPSYYTKAEKAVARSLRLRPDDNAVGHAVAGALAAARHDFQGALDDADQALAVDGYDATALSIRVDALTELGRYDDAREASLRADERQPGLPTATRYAYQLELRGRLGASERVLRRELDSATHASRADVLSLLSDLERRQGRLADAGRDVAQALRERPGHLPALVARARLLVARGDLAAAARTWRTVVRRLPTPEYLTELGELELVRGDRTAAQQQFDVVDATVRLLNQGGVDTDLETALFEADHGDPQAAVADARAEWARRRSIHVADAYAWALHRAGRDREALPIARQATRLGTQEARLWLHRGRIEAALGLTSAARASLQRGIATDPGVSPWQRAQAQSVLRRLR